METKPSFYTSEWWTTLLSSVYLFLNTTGVLNQIPNKWSALGMAIIIGLYNTSRGIAKSKGGYDPHNAGNHKFGFLPQKNPAKR